MPVWPILGDVFSKSPSSPSSSSKPVMLSAISMQQLCISSNDLSPPSSPDSNSERHPNSLLTVPDIDRNGCLATWNPINSPDTATQSRFRFPRFWPTDVLRLLTLPFQSTTSGSSLIQGSAALVWLTAIEAGLVARLSDGLPNNAWDSLTAQAAQNMDVLSNLDNIKILSNVLKTNVSACASIGSFYLPQVGRVMLGLYKAVSGIISETVAREGTIATKTPKIRRLRTVKKEILKLMERYIKKAEDLDIQIYIYM
ncbi:CRM1 C terminal-domain-containing protein [Suillus plorans]|uniref:CRM1 C terminal-domain-containing protein n=1 Tax=Suillus plorans TaxID=116603 RepID=A0A9P7A885_9AGAM|nr:CRM1 C terminal-domain-containing protein [Suillus plorans]KAG1784309.1 CRM1 C terminal-domain-containing protein [Suillus plorans]